jgi:drug/metabolite transporter (DMT)-like permease
MKTAVYTLIALTAFAANSIFCRLALGDESIDPAGFTIIRLLSGAITLVCLLMITNVLKKPSAQHADRKLKITATQMSGSWIAAIALLIYAIAFSYAYVLLDTGTGALILFACVQVSLIIFAILKGQQLNLREWVGLCMAFIGFVYLVFPALSKPSEDGLILMVIAGIAWSIYTIKGKESTQPLADTAWNFVRTLPFLGLLTAVVIDDMHLSIEGVVYAILSGAIASGLGYSVWYLALRKLTATSAAVVQLLVPILAAIGGVIWVQEPITLRMLVSGLIILGGILLVILGAAEKKPISVSA